MAVFGAPVAHEDDAERAVRAALRILDTIEELRAEGLDVTVRAAVTTGEAVVALGARPERGEGIVAGDVVNTAARLQGAAPVGAVIVDSTTMRSTEGAIGFEALESVAAKGKHERIPVWRATTARSRFGVDTEPTRRFAVRRPRRGASGARGDLCACLAGPVRAAAHGRRRAGRGEEQARLGVPRGDRSPFRARALAAGAVPPLRRGNHVLGAWRDRKSGGGRVGDGLAPRKLTTSWGVPWKSSTTTPSARGSPSGSPRSSGRKTTSPAWAGRRRFPPGGAISRRLPLSGRRLS